MVQLRASVSEMRGAAYVVLLSSAVAAAQTPDGAAPKKAAAKKVAAIKVEPNEYTDDPVLGKGARINGEEVHGLVAFTFDDGPNADTTPAVLDALKKYDIPATFFIVTRRLVGKPGEKPREILAREMAEGHL